MSDCLGLLCVSKEVNTIVWSIMLIIGIVFLIYFIYKLKKESDGE